MGSVYATLGALKIEIKQFHGRSGRRKNVYFEIWKLPNVEHRRIVRKAQTIQNIKRTEDFITSIMHIHFFFFFLFGRLKAARRQMRYWILVFWGEQKINQTFAQTKHSTDKSNEMHFSCVRAIFGSFFFSFNQTLKRSIWNRTAIFDVDIFELR